MWNWVFSEGSGVHQMHCSHLSRLMGVRSRTLIPSFKKWNFIKYTLNAKIMTRTFQSFWNNLAQTLCLHSHLSSVLEIFSRVQCNCRDLSGVIRANRFARFARIGWFARIGNSNDSGESAWRAINIGVSIANDSRELIRANRVANRPCH